MHIVVPLASCGLIICILWKESRSDLMAVHLGHHEASVIHIRVQCGVEKGAEKGASQGLKI